VNAEFNWWLLIVGLVIGAGLAWLVLADSSRREADIEERELDAESRWIAEMIADAGRPIANDQVLEILRLHRAYRASAPPDDVGEPEITSDVDRPLHLDAGDRRPMAHPIGPDPDRAVVLDPDRAERRTVQERARRP
jgi:hypothetical protein